jgi:muconate cycloisomerase
MRITQIEAIPIRVPLKAGLTTKTAHGEHVDSPYVIVRVHTDAGLIGLGEATVSPRWSGETSPGCVAAVEQIIGPALTGADPTRITALRFRLERELKLNPFTRAAVEMALWDLAGKAAGIPVYQLLGGKVRERMPIKMVVGAFPVPQAVKLAERFLAWGVRCLKVKVGLDLATDRERVRVVRELAGPGVPVGIDANCGWNPVTARRMLQDLHEYNLLFAEQPIPPGDVRLLAELKRTTAVPLMADESVFTLADAWALTTAQAVDILSVYPGKHGGIAASLEIAHVAQAAGIVCSVGSNLELGIGTAAMLHLAAAAPAIDSETYPADLIGPLYHEADLLTQPLQLGPEAAVVPDGPGLGVELDMKQVERWREG